MAGLGSAGAPGKTVDQPSPVGAVLPVIDRPDFNFQFVMRHFGDNEFAGLQLLKMHRRPHALDDLGDMVQRRNFAVFVARAGMDGDVQVVESGFGKFGKTAGVQVIAIGIDHQSGVRQILPRLSDALKNDFVGERLVIAGEDEVRLEADLAQVIQQEKPDVIGHSFVFAEAVSLGIGAVIAAAVAVRVGFDFNALHRAGKKFFCALAVWGWDEGFFTDVHGYVLSANCSSAQQTLQPLHVGTSGFYRYAISRLRRRHRCQSSNRCRGNRTRQRWHIPSNMH